jgi:hypothetical protein
MAYQEFASNIRVSSAVSSMGLKSSAQNCCRRSRFRWQRVDVANLTRWFYGKQIPSETHGCAFSCWFLRRHSWYNVYNANFTINRVTVKLTSGAGAVGN